MTAIVENASAQLEMKRVQRMLNLRFFLPRIRLIQPLKLGKYSLVYLAGRGEKKIVVKEFWHTKDPRAQVLRTEKVLGRYQLLQAHSPDQRFGVNEYLGGSTRMGVVLLSYEDGETVRDLLRRKHQDRQAVLDACAGWENWAGCTTRELRPFEISNRVSNLERYFETRRERTKHRLAVELRDALIALARTLEGQNCTWSRGHPDFAPRNLIWRQNGEMRGVDIHLSPSLPVARRTARFLVAKDIWTNPRGEDSYLGLNASELHRYLEHGTVPLNERGSLLIYFVGFMFLEQLSMKNMQAGSFCKPRARRYLRDLKKSLAEAA